MSSKISVNPLFELDGEDREHMHRQGDGGRMQPVKAGPSGNMANAPAKSNFFRGFVVPFGFIVVIFATLLVLTVTSATSSPSPSLGNAGDAAPTFRPATKAPTRLGVDQAPTNAPSAGTTDVPAPTKAPIRLGETSRPTQTRTSAPSAAATDAPTRGPPKLGEPIWQDNFDGSALDASKWAPQLGDGSDLGIPGWGNAELQSYASDNVQVADGKLKLTVKQTGAHSYTSGKVRTFGKFTFTYGRVEAKIKTPVGAQGIWSAFWMLPEGFEYGSWASSGEVDILEVANDQKLLTSAIHFGGNWPNNVYKMNQIKAPSGASLHDEFHTYALEWTPSEFRWFLDGQLYHTQRHWWSAHTSETNEITVNPYPKPFDKPFHLILNVAVGGPGTEYTGFKEEDGNRIRDVPQELEVDWVKVYDLTGIPEKTAVKCGDFNCDAGENWMTCPSDCGTYNLPDPVCGDDVCTQGEFVNECPADCTNINPSPPPSSTPPPVPVPGAQPKLLFEDNFDGTVLDSNKWGYQLGNGQEYGIPGWGNGELQSYTDTNAEVAGGNLKIKVLQTDVHAYSSSKIRTLGKFAFKYGRVVAKMKMPLGAQGVWVAMWMLPTPDGSGPMPCNMDKNNGCGDYGPWASSGEIDIVEVGNDQKTLTSATHFGGAWPDNKFKMQATTLPSGASLADAYHEYKIEWTPKEFRWYLDDVLFHTQRHWYSVTKAKDGKVYENAHPQPFDKPFHLIMNVAVGGPTTEYTGYKQEDGNRIRDVPQELLVDWIRVYDDTNLEHATPVKCGDFNCDAGETRANCPSDCGTGNTPDPVCGDGVCAKENGEFPHSCSADCA